MIGILVKCESPYFYECQKTRKIGEKMSEEKLNNKINIELDEIQFETLDWKGKEIIVKTFINQADKMFIYNNYAGLFFDEEGMASGRFLSAKYTFMLSVLGLCTNIETKDLDLDTMVASGLWYQIVSKISNYDRVNKDLYALTKMMSEERLVKKSIGQIVDETVTKVIDFVSKLDEYQVDEELKSLVDEFKGGVKKLEDNGIIVPENISQKSE